MNNSNTFDPQAVKKRMAEMNPPVLQSDIAAALGVTPASVNRWLKDAEVSRVAMPKPYTFTASANKEYEYNVGDVISIKFPDIGCIYEGKAKVTGKSITTDEDGIDWVTYTIDGIGTLKKEVQ